MRANTPDTEWLPAPIASWQCRYCRSGTIFVRVCERDDGGRCRRVEYRCQSCGRHWLQDVDDDDDDDDDDDSR